MQKQRSIRRIKTVQYQTNSPIHRNGFVLEPGNWQEYDPFLIYSPKSLPPLSEV
jgi:quercetin 2,3-dioxygenase